MGGSHHGRERSLSIEGHLDRPSVSSGGPSPVEGVDAVAWQSLTAAYGEADRIPSILKLLVSVRTSDVDAAWEQLDEQIILHQGTVYPATEAAIPFLVSIAVRPQSLRRPRLISYLGLLSLGVESSHSPGSAQLVREAVRSRLGAFKGLLDTADLTLGLAMAELAAALPFDLATAVSLVRRMQALTDDPEIIGALAGAAAMLGVWDTETQDVLHRVERDSVVRGRRGPSGLTVFPAKGPEESSRLDEIATVPVYSSVKEWRERGRRDAEDKQFFNAARYVSRLFWGAAAQITWMAP